MSYRIIHIPTDKTVHYDHTRAGCDHWIRNQRHPQQYRVEEND